MPAQTFTQRVDEATKGIAQASNVRADVRTALTTCRTSLNSVFTNYDSLADQDKQFVDDSLINLARFLESAMR